MSQFFTLPLDVQNQLFLFCNGPDLAALAQTASVYRDLIYAFYTRLFKNWEAAWPVAIKHEYIYALKMIMPRAPPENYHRQMRQALSLATTTDKLLMIRYFHALVTQMFNKIITTRIVIKAIMHSELYHLLASMPREDTLIEMHKRRFYACFYAREYGRVDMLVQLKNECSIYPWKEDWRLAHFKFKLKNATAPGKARLHSHVMYKYQMRWIPHSWLQLDEDNAEPALAGLASRGDVDLFREYWQTWAHHCTSDKVLCAAIKYNHSAIIRLTFSQAVISEGSRYTCLATFYDNAAALEVLLELFGNLFVRAPLVMRDMITRTITHASNIYRPQMRQLLLIHLEKNEADIKRITPHKLKVIVETHID